MTYNWLTYEASYPLSSMPKDAPISIEAIVMTHQTQSDRSHSDLYLTSISELNTRIP